jgi:hypothetical protein
VIGKTKIREKIPKYLADDADRNILLVRFARLNRAAQCWMTLKPENKRRIHTKKTAKN